LVSLKSNLLRCTVIYLDEISATEGLSIVAIFFELRIFALQCQIQSILFTNEY